MNIEMIRAANQRLEGHVRRTPLLIAPLLDAVAGRRVWVKPECLQHTGSFKFRGGWSAVSAMAPEVRAKGVIAYSSGNHAQGVAYAAQRHGVTAVIVMPGDSPQLKIDNTRAYGGEVVLYDRDNESREEIGSRLSEERGLTLGDVVLGISASGTTPFVLGALEAAHKVGARTIGITCDPGSPLAESVEIAIAPLVGPEVVTGSTRMKGGLAQKMILSALSTSVMVKMGRVRGHHMTHVSPGSSKLRGRAVRIVMEVGGIERDTARELLRRTEGSVEAALQILEAERLSHSG